MPFTLLITLGSKLVEWEQSGEQFLWNLLHKAEDFVSALCHIENYGNIVREKSQLKSSADSSNMSSAETNEYLTMIKILGFLIANASGVAQRAIGGTGTTGIMMGHRPEVYLSWLYALSGEELFGREDAMSVDLRVRPIKRHFTGVVLAEYAKGDYGRITAYLLDNSMHLRLDNDGNLITVERFDWTGYYSPWNWYLRMILLDDRYLYSEYRVVDGADFLYYEIQYQLYDLLGNVPLLFSAKTDENGILVLTDNKFETHMAPVEIGKVGSTLNVELMT